MTVLQRFFESLNGEESKFIPTLAADNLGILLRCAINELDWYYYNLIRTENPSDEQREQFYILQLGVIRFIKLALDARKSFDVPTVTTVRRSELTVPVLEIASALGMIQHGRRVAQTIAQGIGSILEVAQNQFEITLPQEILDDDYYERAVLEHYKSETRRRYVELTNSDKWKEVEALVNSRLYELVFPFKTHFIGYGGDPLLDEFFFTLAYNEIRLEEGFDTFPYRIRFGGIQFQSYMFALTFMVAICFRHERFAEALVRKEPRIRLENILTVSADIESFIESIRDAVNRFGGNFENFEKIEIPQARSIFEILSCGRSDTALIDAPGSPLPLMVRSSEEGLIKCLTGSRSEPVRFLLESLRYHYPKEYDNHQQGREASMQRSVRRVLNETFSGLEYRENITLKLSDRTLTDIDLVILEKSTGLVIICQLKHQELYGADLYAKQLRGDRLRKQVRRWIEMVDEWLKVVGIRRIRETLQLIQEFPEPLLYKLVISRHFSHPLKGVLDDSTVHTNWLEFFNANELVKRDFPERKIRNLLQILRVQNSHSAPAHMPEPTTKWAINELTFTTKQEGAEEKQDGSST
jgi:hypothetical protein